MARQDDSADLMGRMAAVLEQLAENAPVQEIGYGHPKYQERLKEEGFFTEFARPVYQNGKEAQARGLTPETIDRAPKLRPGKYIGGLVEVMRDNKDRVHLIYKTASTEDRMKNSQKLGSFDQLIEKIWTEMHAA